MSTNQIINGFVPVYVESPFQQPIDPVFFDMAPLNYGVRDPWAQTGGYFFSLSNVGSKGIVIRDGLKFPTSQTVNGLKF